MQKNLYLVNGNTLFVVVTERLCSDTFRTLYIFVSKWRAKKKFIIDYVMKCRNSENPNYFRKYIDWLHTSAQYKQVMVNWFFIYAPYFMYTSFKNNYISVFLHCIATLLVQCRLLDEAAYLRFMCQNKFLNVQNE